jgi:predicted nuclease of predicted toxin-antitoxin system
VNPPKLLLDEHLSPTIAVVLRSLGLDAIHVRDRSLNGSSDAQVLERAFVEDRIVVTLNVVDFVRLARAREVHAGLILLAEGGTRGEQLQIVQRAITIIDAEFVAGRDMVNRALRLAVDGHEFETLP